MNRKDIAAALVIAAAGAWTIGLSAQSEQTKTTTKTKVELKGGKDVTVRGCLERTPGGDFVLTHVDNEKGLERGGYSLVSDADLSKHEGERVEIKGKTTENGDGKVAVESKEKTETEHGSAQERTTKTEATGGTLALPVLGVKSIDKLSSTCG
jgi:hypothetical protein